MDNATKKNAVFAALAFGAILVLLVGMPFLKAADSVSRLRPIYIKGGKLKKYCAADSNKNIQCNLDATNDQSTFRFEDLGDGTFALKNKGTNQYCHDQGDKIVCHSDQIGAHEKFHLKNQPEGPNTFAMTGPKSGSKRLFCGDEGNRIVCNRKSVGAWEKYTFELAPDSQRNSTTSVSPSSSTAPKPVSANTTTITSPSRTVPGGTVSETSSFWSVLWASLASLFR